MLSNVKQLVESVNFPNQTSFEFILSITDSSAEIYASIDKSLLTISIPTDIASEWINTNEVGIESLIVLDGDEQLHVLIEKDFPCKDRPDEDKSDTFTELAKEQSPKC